MIITTGSYVKYYFLFVLWHTFTGTHYLVDFVVLPQIRRMSAGQYFSGAEPLTRVTPYAADALLVHVGKQVLFNTDHKMCWHCDRK